MNAPNVIGQLERWLVELASKWERHFAGDRQVSVPPERERTALERRLQEVSRAEAPTTGERFRMEQLLHRFSSLNQLWQRQLREREEARQRAGVACRAPNEIATPSVSHRGQEILSAFTRYRDALAKVGRDVPVGFDGFRQTLEQQRQHLEASGSMVEGFEVVEDGGSVRVRARVRCGRQK